MTYDYLIVGAGLFGAVFAHEASAKGKKVLVIDKRNHIAGNIYTKTMHDVDVHWYGPHIFHTSNHEVWAYINQFGKFNHFINAPLAVHKGKLYNLPFNMNTFHQLWGVTTPQEAQRKIEEQKGIYQDLVPSNLEEQAIKLVGKEIYEKFIKGYTEKQWGKACIDLPAFIINRLPVRFTYDNNYFNDRYQGIPIEGYTKLVERMLENVEVKLGVDFFEHKQELLSISKKVVYTGPIDQYFEYAFDALEYRSLKFDHEVFDIENYQGNAVINYTDREIAYTRIIEHKHFNFGKQHNTIITKEYPSHWKPGTEAYYPINSERNQKKYALYKEKADKEPQVIFGGRLAEYKYYDMDKVIESALNLCKKELK